MGRLLGPAALSLHCLWSLVRGQTIDPAIYAKVFENNMPMFEEITKLVVESGAKAVLDLGTGPGEPATLIAKALPGAKVVATDFQEGMLDKAKSRGAGLSNIEYKVASADDLSAFGDSSMDAVTANYVLMFVPDREKAIREIARVLTPGGRAYIGVWKSLSMVTVAAEVLETLLGRQPAPPLVNPLALSADRAVEKIIAGVPGVAPKFSTMVSYNFKWSGDHVSCDLAMIYVGPEINKLVDAGEADVKDRFCKLLVEANTEAGYRDEHGNYEVFGNNAQLLVLEKAGSKAEL